MTGIEDFHVLTHHGDDIITKENSVFQLNKNRDIVAVSRRIALS